jgi:hypothetical protein
MKERKSAKIAANGNVCESRLRQREIAGERAGDPT